jgi:hypothetical protein
LILTGRTGRCFCPVRLRDAFEEFPLQVRQLPPARLDLLWRELLEILLSSPENLLFWKRKERVSVLTIQTGRRHASHLSNAILSDEFL